MSNGLVDYTGPLCIMVFLWAPVLASAGCTHGMYVGCVCWLCCSYRLYNVVCLMAVLTVRARSVLWHLCGLLCWPVQALHMVCLLAVPVGCVVHTSMQVLDLAHKTKSVLLSGVVRPSSVPL